MLEFHVPQTNIILAFFGLLLILQELLVCSGLKEVYLIVILFLQVHG